MRPARNRLWLWLYVGVVIAAAASLLTWEITHPGPVGLGLWELALFTVLAAALELMMVPLAEGGGVAASFAVYFAGLLVLGPAAVAWVAALVELLCDGVIRRIRVVRAAFNSAHSVLSLLAAGWLFQALGGEVDRVVLPTSLLPVVAAALCLWALEMAWVAVAVSLERGARVTRWLRLSLTPMLGLDTALASVGLLLALLYQSRSHLIGTGGWQGPALLGLIALIPSGLLYYAYRLQGHLRQVYAQSLRSLGALLERKVEGSQHGHGERVGALAAAMAQALELPPQQAEQIRYAGFLHDIGKVGVPAALLASSRNHFDGEAQPLRLHPQIGEQILSPIHFLHPAAQIVRAHHERWDGLGYPDGLRHDAIPRGARLLTIANAYVGMTAALSPSEALSRIRQAAGSRFDPTLADTLGSLLEQWREVERPLSQLPQMAEGATPFWML